MKIKQISINIFLSLFSIYLPLILFSLISFYSPNNINKVLWDKKKGEDLRLKISAINSGYSPERHPNYFLNLINKNEYYPIGGYPYKNNYLCNEGYGLFKYKSDRFGLRNLDTKWGRVKNIPNIFLIGDSFIHGHCVSEKDTIPSHLERLTGKNTINLGMAANGPYEYMANLNLIINPIIKNSEYTNSVVLTFYTNDNDKERTELNLKRLKLLDSNKPIIKYTEKESLRPSSKYLKSLEAIYKNNDFVQNSEELVLRVRNPSKK